ncbi:acetylxylan esterase, partial [bacterium]|nr:acetylxylan esterase [bacterium]
MSPVLAREDAPPVYGDKVDLLAYVDGDGQARRITTAEGWRRHSEHILASMQLVMGELPAASRKVPLDVRLHEEVRLPKFTRKKITFAVEKGDRVPAYLLVPHDLKGKTPAMLCLHQTTRIGKDEP